MGYASAIMVAGSRTSEIPFFRRCAALARWMLRWHCMRSLGLVLPGILVIGALCFACGDMASSADFGDGAERGNNGGQEPSASNGDKNGGSATPPELVPTDNGVIMVHAAGMPAFRLCFENELDRRPQPDSDVMPDANVVGVEVGSAVRLAPLRGAPGKIYVFAEPLLRDEGFSGGKGRTCSALLQDATMFKLAHEMKPVASDLSKGVHLLVLKGCQGKTIVTYTKGECGEDYDENNPHGNLAMIETELKGGKRTGNELPSQVIHLARPLESARNGAALAVSFGDVKTNDSPHSSVAVAPQLFGAPLSLTKSPSFDPTNDAIYADVGFRVTLTNGTNAPQVVAQQSLADVQKLSAPREIPSTYFAAASNYVLLLLGHPAPKLNDGGPNDDPLRKVHLLAVPVIEPKDDAGAGDAGGTGTADGGSPDGAL